MSAYVLIAAEEEQLSGEAVAVTAAPTAAEDSATPVPAAATGDSATPVPAAAAPVKTELSYIELKALLKDCQDGNNCRVSKVDFMDSLGESGIAYVDGAPLDINGIPKDDPSNDSSPYKLMAKCRDAKVPYTFPFTRTMRDQQAARASQPPKEAEPAMPSFSIPSIELPKLSMPSFSLPF